MKPCCDMERSLLKRVGRNTGQTISRGHIYFYLILIGLLFSTNLKAETFQPIHKCKLTSSSQYADSEKTRIDVLFAFTKPRPNSSDVKTCDNIETLIDQANKVFEDSGIEVYLNLVYAYQTAYKETADEIGKTLNLFKMDYDDNMDEVHCLRKQYKADIAVLIVSYSPDRGAWACDIPAKKSTAFAILTSRYVRQDIKTKTNHFAHEIGHLLGGQHDITDTSMDKDSTTYSPYGCPSLLKLFPKNEEICNVSYLLDEEIKYCHGFKSSSCGKKTIMSRGSASRLSYFSNSKINIPECGGLSLSSEFSDNARLFNQTAKIVADFY